MALISDINLSSGLTIEKAYIKLSNFYGDEETLNFRVDVYVDKDSFSSGKASLESISYNVRFDPTRNLIGQVYEHLRSLPEFKNAVTE